MPSHFKIRKSTLKDSGKIAKLFSVEYSKPPYSGKWTFARSLKKVREYYKNHEVYVGAVEKEIIGFIMFRIYEDDSGKEIYIKELVVGSKFQGKGYGKALMLFVESYGKKRDVKKMSLSSNKKSKAFKIYKRLGWKEDKVFVYMNKKIFKNK